MTNASPKKNFNNSFWGPGDKGFQVLLSRMKKGKKTTEEIHNLMKERSALEEEYGKKLAKLARNFVPNVEIGTLGDSLQIIRQELEQNARAHLDLAQDIKEQLARPLQEFVETQATVRRTHQRNIEKLQSSKQLQETQVIAKKEKYDRCTTEYLELQEILKQAPKNKELDKLRIKAEKMFNLQRQHDQEYMVSTDKLANIHENWKTDMNMMFQDYEKLEQDRFNFIRGNLWKYANLLSQICVLNDESSERIRLGLERCDHEKDTMLFLDTCSTGSEIPGRLDQQFGRIQLDDNNSLSSQGTGSRTDEPKNGHKFAFQQSTETRPKAGDRSLYEPESMMESTFLYDPFEVPENVPVQFTVRVLYDYACQAREELTIKKDQLIPVIATHEDGWWEGLAVEDGRRRKGLFPSNFTEHV